MSLWKKKNRELSPDEVFLDATEIPGFMRERMEGVLEKPIGKGAFLTFTITLILFAWVLYGRVVWLQVVRGQELTARSESNYVQTTYIEPPRGIIYDRNGSALVSNLTQTKGDGELTYSRVARHSYAFSHVLGFIGLLSEEDISNHADIPGVPEIGKSGIEQEYNDMLRGVPGSQGQEYDVSGNIISQGAKVPAFEGEDIALTIDADLQEKIYQVLDRSMSTNDYLGAAGVVMSIDTGEILALVSAPSFDVNAFSRGLTQVEAEQIFTDKRAPLFNRAIAGLYAPGSIIKPFLALAALEEDIIDPKRELYSSGVLEVPDPYREGEVSKFADWRAHGYIDMRRAIAVSSNVYFYSVGGGYEDIQGLGITRIKKWLTEFGLGELTGIDLPGERSGFLPDPEWKKTAHPDNPIWRVGDTYHVSIGQGDILETPLGIARGLALIASKGNKVTPHILKTRSSDHRSALSLDENTYSIVHEGMYQTTRPGGTAGSLSNLGFEMAGKTGSAETSKEERVHSWFMGFAPYENPKLGLVVFLESGPRANSVGAVAAASEILGWMDASGYIR
jgi:penicillin-binding protein 2